MGATVATSCPSIMLEHPKSKSTRPNCQTTRITLYHLAGYNLPLTWIWDVPPSCLGPPAARIDGIKSTGGCNQPDGSPCTDFLSAHPGLLPRSSRRRARRCRCWALPAASASPPPSPPAASEAPRRSSTAAALGRTPSDALLLWEGSFTYDVHSKNRGVQSQIKIL